MAVAVALAACLAGAAPALFGQSTDPLQTIVPVHLDGATGDIQVGATTYKGGNPGFHVLALKRQPNSSHLDAPDLISDKTYPDTSSVTSALDAILGQVPDALLIINAAGGYGGAVSDVAQKVKKFGAYDDLALITNDPPFILVGIGGSNAKTRCKEAIARTMRTVTWPKTPTETTRSCEWTSCGTTLLLIRLGGSQVLYPKR